MSTRNLIRIRQWMSLGPVMAMAFTAVTARAQAPASAPVPSPDQPTLESLRQQIDILATEVSRLRMGDAGVRADQSLYGFGPGASKIYRQERGVSIGGYGEMIYSNFQKTLQDGSASLQNNQFNLLRAVVYVGYKFEDGWLFNSEVEFENASTERSGAVSVEFAYLDKFISPAFNVRAGLMLMPLGFINELHEPIVFLSALRPQVEQIIIPTTWSEGGVGIFGDLGPFTYRTYLVNGMDASSFGATGIASGRQLGSFANASTLANVGRLDLASMPGFHPGLGYYIGKASTRRDLLAGGGLTLDMRMLDLHLDWRYRALQVRALGAMTWLGSTADLNSTRNLVGTNAIGDREYGAYLEVGYEVLSRPDQSLVPFLRFESLDTQYSVADGWASDPANRRKFLTGGIVYKPITQLAIKCDATWEYRGNNQGQNLWDLGLGYVF